MKCLKVTIVTDIFTYVLQEFPHWDINACKSDFFKLKCFPQFLYLFFLSTNAI